MRSRIRQRRRSGVTRLLGGALAGALLLFGVSGCANGREPDAPASGGEIRVGLLLPDSVTARYQSADRPYFEAEIERIAPGTTVLYGNADGDAAKQLQQAESMLTQGVSVLVLSPFDSSAAATIVAEAKERGVPVVSYDRMIDSPDIEYYVSFDNRQVGRLQALALADRVQTLGGDEPGEGILMVNGSPTDNNASEYKRGAHDVLDGSGVAVLAEYDVPGWDPIQAQNWVAGQITKFGDRITGIYVANDSMAAGAIAAMRSAGVAVPPVTGQDAELAGIQRILSGDQYMTVYKAMKPEAEKAAEVAVLLARGGTPEGDTVIDGIPSTLLSSAAVTVDDIAATVIADGFLTVNQICTSAYERACAEHGLLDATPTPSGGPTP
ncbi:sugar ABC transporter substrate-binding protein [Microbacteriaceae bacterium VKM Ac-2854]|nr:sugar ABC transporter substrate-binding protein [Microbacteriaceae bacterium VKM Ac-2854]